MYVKTLPFSSFFLQFQKGLEGFGGKFQGLDDALRLHGADALDVWVVRQVVGQPLGTHPLVEFEVRHLELAPELRMPLPGAVEYDRVVLPHHQGAGERHRVARVSA